MSRIVLALFLLLTWLSGVAAQSLTGLTRIVPEQSEVRDTRVGTDIVLALGQGVPFRVFTLDDPARLVVDFSEVDFAGAVAAELLPVPGRVQAVRFGAYRPGWSRFVADLKEAMLPTDVAMNVNEGDGTAELTIAMTRVSDAEFGESSGAPEGSTWLPEQTTVASQDVTPGQFVVVLDPGHGGVDPGAERDGLVEKQLVLEVALQLREQLRREAVSVVLTRDRDSFVSLETRTAIAHQAQGSLFISLHADALSQGGARGATVYTLSDKASDEASALLAARHNRSDILAGIDLTGADDQVTSVLLDLARQETEPRSVALATSVIDAMDQAGGPMNRKPWRKAGFSVLKSADIPSVLVELGFLSDERDRKNLANPEWRQRMTAALAQAILNWRDADAARSQLVRQ